MMQRNISVDTHELCIMVFMKQGCQSGAPNEKAYGTHNCGCYGNQNGKEPEMLANYGENFCYHGHQVTKTTDFDF